MSHALSRKIVHRMVSRTREGKVELHETGHDAVSYGDHGGMPPLAAAVEIHDPRFHRELLRGSLGLATSYVDGVWDADDLVTLIRIAARNASRFDSARRAFRPVLGPLQAGLALARRNTIARSRKQISAHYDIGNDLYERMLDPTMMYSAAVFEDPGMTLEEAQRCKLERICRKLDLGPGDHLLEIGTGWGAMAIHAAQRTGCRVTTTTISREQHALAVARVREAGLEDRVTVLLEDYRRLTGRYDKLVSIEMIEAVGWRDFPTYFRRLGELLEPDGLALVQAITIDDRAYEVEKATKSFINQLIFPGGCLPSVEVITRNVSRESDLRLVQLEDITAHYVTTLDRWRANFLAHADELDALGYDARFRRLWTLYLAYCEAGFAERRIQDVQVLLAGATRRAEPQFATTGPVAGVAVAA